MTCSSCWPSPQRISWNFSSLVMRAEIRTDLMEKSESQETLKAMASDADDGSFADSSLLDTIDKLFELNVGDYVALPQVSQPNY